MRAFVIAIAALLVCTAAPAVAQTAVTQADIQRLQDNVYDAGTDVSRLRDRDARLADSLQRDLDDLRDEVIYIKVKLRKESKVQCPRSNVGTRSPPMATQLYLASCTTRSPTNCGRGLTAAKPF